MTDENKLVFSTDIRPTHEVSYSDLNSYFTKEYGRTFDFVPIEEVSNDSETVYDIGSDDCPSKFDHEDVEDFRKTGRAYIGLTRSLLLDQIDQGRLPRGRWIINVGW